MARKENPFFYTRVSRNLPVVSFCCCMFSLICIKFLDKDDDLLFADSLKAVISGHVICWLELTDV